MPNNQFQHLMNNCYKAHPKWNKTWHKTYFHNNYHLFLSSCIIQQCEQGIHLAPQQTLKRPLVWWFLADCGLLYSSQSSYWSGPVIDLTPINEWTKPIQTDTTISSLILYFHIYVQTDTKWLDSFPDPQSSHHSGGNVIAFVCA